MLAKVKAALRLTTNAYDSELTDMVNAALLDLGIVGIDPDILVTTTTNALIVMAVITYCRVHFGTPDDREFARLKASYDEQKSQLMTCSFYNGRIADVVEVL